MFCKIILPNNEIYVIQNIPKSFQDLKQLIRDKYHDQLPEHFSLKYKDSDDELILLSNDEDLQQALLDAKGGNMKNLRIEVSQQQNFSNSNVQRPRSPNKTESPNTKILQRPSYLRSELNQIPLTESINELPADTSGEYSNRNDKKEQKKHNFDEYGIGSETLSQFYSPMDKSGVLTGNMKRLDRQDSLNIDLNKEEAFSPEQMRIIGEIIQKSVKKQITDKLENILTDLVSGLPNQVRSNLAFKQNRQNMSQSTSGSVPSPFGMTLSTKKCKELKEVDDISCNECRKKIKDIRYHCLTCKNFNCCEKCENNVEHAHPLLKIRLSKGSDNTNLENVSQIRDNNFDEESNMYNTKSTKDGVLGNKSLNSRPQDGVREDARTFIRSMTMNDMGKPLETCDVKDFMRYKVALVKEPLYDVITVKSNHQYSVEFTLKNAGVNKWTNRVSLICISGIHKGQEEALPHLDQGREHVVKLSLRAPIDCGRYLSQWQLHYYDGEVAKPFGKPIYIEIDVCQADKESGSKAEHIHSADNHHKEHKDSRDKDKNGKKNNENTQNKDEELMRGCLMYILFTINILIEMKCSEQILKRAKLLNDMFPGEIKEKITFVNEFSSIQNINDLVSAYLDRLSSTSLKRINLTRTSSVKSPKTKSLSTQLKIVYIGQETKISVVLF